VNADAVCGNALMADQLRGTRHIDMVGASLRR
jgi:hypothetical protein